MFGYFISHLKIIILEDIILFMNIAIGCSSVFEYL